MQVKELITFYINESSKTLDVSFRLETDGEEEIRNDSILIETIEEFGYDFFNHDDEIYETEEDIFDNYYEDDNDNFIDEDEITSFLNEYYMINPQKLPTVEPF